MVGWFGGEGMGRRWCSWNGFYFKYDSSSIHTATLGENPSRFISQKFKFYQKTAVNILQFRNIWLKTDAFMNTSLKLSNICLHCNAMTLK